MKILVTGANGYLGPGIVKHLLDHQHTVIAAGRHLDCVDNRAVKVCGNIFEMDNPYDMLECPDVLLHLAWKDGFIHYSDSHIEELPKHFAFIKKFAQSEVKQICVMGSMHEIGFYEGCIKEDTPCNPITPYGISKNALRELCEMLCRQHNKLFQWLRGYYIVGNDPRGSSIFSKIAAAESEGKDIFPFTMGENQYDFIDYEDFCEFTANAVGQQDILGIINICSGYPEKLKDRVERFITENQYRIKLNYGAFPDRPYDSKAVWGDRGKLDAICSAAAGTDHDLPN